MTNTLQVLNWENFSETYLKKDNIDNALKCLDDELMHRTYLVDDTLSDADKYIYLSLSTHLKFLEMLKDSKVPDNVTRYFNHISDIEEVKRFVDAHMTSQKEISKKNATKKEPKPEKSESKLKFEDGGKFIGLKGAQIGKVVVRFPPEASGYLHIGHAKAALINQHYKDHYQGELIMRFDDTNPAKESSEFEHVILEDVKKLGITYDRLTYTSDHFDTLITYCNQMLKAGQAYVDDTDPETMKKEREACQESRCRSQSVEENENLWKEMLIGSERGKKCCVRVKFDMASKNGCMRDPTIYRCKAEPHVRTGDKYKVYPTYDFACPIVDSIEGVTHSLRTSEYIDRNEQFYSILDLLSMRKPDISDYSRLSLQNTVLSKRRLTWIVDEGYVDSWEDARMPTVRGILRHGMTVEGLKEFVIAQGFGRANVVMEWDKIWAFNKKVIDPVAPRFTALSAASGDVVVVRVKGQINETKGKVARHPKNEDVGLKDIFYTPRILVERSDVADFVEGTNVTFINWGNMKIDSLNKDANGVVESVDVSLNLDDKDFKKTLKVTWLPVSGSNEIESELSIPISVMTYGDLITKNVLEKDDDFKNFMSKDSKKEECMIGDAELASLKRGDIVQLQRKGYFICDEEYRKGEYPLVLVNIPEGNKKERVTTGMKQKNTGAKEEPEKAPKVAKEISGDKSLKGNSKAEKSPQEAKEKKEKANEKKVKDVATKPSGSDKTKKVTRLCLEATREDNFADWYSQVITKSELMDYYDISGLYVLRPNACDIWEAIQASVNVAIKKKKVKACYFPLFISEDSLRREKDHIADFSPEVAWVTMQGETTLQKKMAIRPTSETAMYPKFAQWIQSYRQLPLKLNQWCNVVRMELKDPVPFLRSREFLWQEGHTVYSNREDAVAEVYDILDMYANVYEELLAVPVVKGRKTEKEKFAGADFTTTTEVYIGATGRAIQGATSHHLGQNFSKMFDFKFVSKDGGLEYAYQNSWGMTTRTIGILVMVHGDNKGLVLPPRVADVQVIIVPCGEAGSEEVLNKCEQVCERLVAMGVRAETDLDDNRQAGWKFNHHELRGVPMRMEIGPRDVANGQVVLAYRFGGRKETIGDAELDSVPERLEQVHRDMLEGARKELVEHRVVVHSMDEFCVALDNKMLVTAPFCGDKECEDVIKVVSARNAVVEEGAPSMGAKSLCIPFEQPENLGNKCVNGDCKREPKYFTMFGRSY